MTALYIFKINSILYKTKAWQGNFFIACKTAGKGQKRLSLHQILKIKYILFLQYLSIRTFMKYAFNASKYFAKIMDSLR